MNSLQLDRFPLQSKLQPVSIQPSLANIESYLKRIKIQVKRIRGRSQNRLQVYLFGKKTLLDQLIDVAHDVKKARPSLSLSSWIDLSFQDLQQQQQRSLFTFENNIYKNNCSSHLVEQLFEAKAIKTHKKHHYINLLRKVKKKEWLFLMVTFTKGFFASNCIKNE